MKEKAKPAAPAEAKKKVYHAPRLLKLGSLAKLTAGTGSAGLDLGARKGFP